MVELCPFHGPFIFKFIKISFVFELRVICYSEYLVFDFLLKCSVVSLKINWK
jgi:hypothetical protein